MRYVPSSRIGRLLLLILLFIVLLVLLSVLFGGFQKGTRYNGGPPGWAPFTTTGW
jgi:hypothetical protein